MSKEILSNDRGLVSELHYDAAEDKTIIKKVQDVEPILKANKEAFNNAETRWGDMAHVARIPMIVIEQWNNEDGINYLAPENRKKLMARLNNPENQFLRTRPGQL